MHLTIYFRSEKELRLPIHYNHILQGLIYNNISAELAEFLHKKGFVYEKRQFKHFAYSKIFGEYKLDKRRREIVFTEQFSLVVASPLAEFCKELGNILLLSDNVLIQNNTVKVEKINIHKPMIVKDIVDLKMLSPAVAYSTFEKPDGGRYTCYYHPKEKEFAQQLDSNLRKKYFSLYRKDAPEQPVTIVKSGEIKQSIIKYKGTIIKGYTCKLRLSGPSELLQMALDSGIQSKNSQGFGCVDLFIS